MPATGMLMADARRLRQGVQVVRNDHARQRGQGTQRIHRRVLLLRQAKRERHLPLAQGASWSQIVEARTTCLVCSGRLRWIDGGRIRMSASPRVTRKTLLLERSRGATARRATGRERPRDS